MTTSMITAHMSKVLAALVAAVVLAGCGGSAAGGTAATEAGGDATSAAVTIDDLAYSPANLQVAVGTEVVWSNDDDTAHTVTFDDDAITSSDKMDRGGDFSTTFDNAGTYSYLCAIHPEMTAKVTVS